MPLCPSSVLQITRQRDIKLASQPKTDVRQPSSSTSTLSFVCPHIHRLTGRKFLMAVPHMQTQKGRRAELKDPHPELQDPPPKRIKTAKSNFPPKFWDNLSKVSATPRALRELDRRKNARLVRKPPAPAVHPTDLERFARRGGPDLRHLRGVSRPDRPSCGSG